MVYFKNPSGVHGELQIMGSKVQELSNLEHIQYDASIGKDYSGGFTAETLPQAANILDPIRTARQSLNAEAEKTYYDYLNRQYIDARRIEQGLPTSSPKLPSGIPSLLDVQNLERAHRALEGLKGANRERVIGSAAQPRMTWVDNAHGVIRTPQEMIALAKQHGVLIPEDVGIHFVENDQLLNTVGAKAEYSQLPRNAANQGAKDLITWDSLKNSQGKIPVRFSTDLLTSDEAAVAHIGHEMYELNKFEDIGSMKLIDFRRAIMDSRSGGTTNNWHEQAWDYADSLVRKMRGGN